MPRWVIRGGPRKAKEKERAAVPLGRRRRLAFCRRATTKSLAGSGANHHPRGMKKKEQKKDVILLVLRVNPFLPSQEKNRPKRVAREALRVAWHPTIGLFILFYLRHGSVAFGAPPFDEAHSSRGRLVSHINPEHRHNNQRGDTMTRMNPKKTETRQTIKTVCLWSMRER